MHIFYNINKISFPNKNRYFIFCEEIVCSTQYLNVVLPQNHTFSAKVDVLRFENKPITLKTVKFLLFNIEYTNFANSHSNLIDIYFTILDTIQL